MQEGVIAIQAIGRLGLIIPEIIDPLNYELLGGVYDRAKQLSYDVLAFTGVLNSQLELNYTSHIISLENIYELVRQGDLDGILYAADLFYNPNTKQHIYQLLQEVQIPCLVLGEQQPYFPTQLVSQRDIMRRLTDHLIRHHQYRDFYFLAGLPGHFDSGERMAGFLDALQAADLPWDESRLFYGDFWRDKPQELARAIAEGEIRRPQAIVCANDVMAVALCEVLRKYEVQVPQDIAVTGFDGSWCAYVHSPQITTVSGRYYQLGAESAEQMHRMLGGTVTDPIGCCQEICYGASCGCQPLPGMDRAKHTILSHYIRNRIDRTLHQKQFMATNLIQHMDQAEDLDEFARKADSCGYILPGWRWMDLCLCQDWMFDFQDPTQYRRRGFSDTMILALSKRYPVNEPSGQTFSTRSLIPALHQPHEPMLVVFTSLHAEGQIFGYAATGYDDAHALFIDEHYVNWLDAVSNGLVSLQRLLYQRHQRQQLELRSDYDPATGLYNKKGFLAHTAHMLAQNQRDGHVPVLLLFSCPRADEASQRTGIDPALIVANALRLSAGQDEGYARLEEQVFGVLLFAQDTASWESRVEERMLALMQRYKQLQGCADSIQLPELISVHCSIGHVQPTLETVLDEQLIRLAEMGAKQAANTMPDYRQQLQKLRRELYCNPQADWSVPTVLRRIGISRSHFYRIYKEQFATGYTEDLIHARMEQAQQLLRHTDLRIHEIASKCGYHNEGHFMRQFKERLGITPSCYRSQNIALTKKIS